jgi:hypothetical protein
MILTIYRWRVVLKKVTQVLEARILERVVEINKVVDSVVMCFLYHMLQCGLDDCHKIFIRVEL